MSTFNMVLKYLDGLTYIILLFCHGRAVRAKEVLPVEVSGSNPC